MDNAEQKTQGTSGTFCPAPALTENTGGHEVHATAPQGFALYGDAASSAGAHVSATGMMPAAAGSDQGALLLWGAMHYHQDGQQDAAGSGMVSGAEPLPEVDQHYLELLSTQYPNQVAAFSEIINLQAILNLPKGTEHFVSDLHGEYGAFRHILNSCSGVIHEKVDDLFAELSAAEKSELCTLIYYPQEVMSLLAEQGKLTDAWYREKLLQLIGLCKYLSAKYTRSKVRKAINQNYSYIIDELLHAQSDESDSRAIYHEQIIATILRTRAAPHFVSTLCALSKRLAVDHLHVVGDVFDRGPSPDKIMALLMDYHSLDIQWGNHDILWMGAALGSEVCMATVLRNNINYFNCSMLESAYGISLRKLNDFAQKTYRSPVKERSPQALAKKAQVQAMWQKQQAAGNIPASVFTPADYSGLSANEAEQHAIAHAAAAAAVAAATAEGAAASAGAGAVDAASGVANEVDQAHEYELMLQAYADDNREKMVKAITVIGLKLQGQLIKRNPDLGMDDRLLLDKMDLKAGTVKIGGKEYALNTVDLPTVDPKDPFALTRDEAWIVAALKKSFMESRELQREVAFLFSHGSIYKRFNGNLLYHGCVPMTDDGQLREINCHGQVLKGKAFLDYCEQVARHAFAYRDQHSLDFMYYLWCGFNSPLSGRVMKPFERYFIDDKSTHHEPRDPYYRHYYSEDVCRMILEEFGLDPDKGHIINGHTPIKVREGEKPVRGNGKLFVIDGGLCQAYHSTTGIAGYTLICSSHGMTLKAHRPFESTEKAIREHVDMKSDATEVEHYSERLRVASSDTGKNIVRTIHELEALLQAYQNGTLIERATPARYGQS